jgi:hypothetical protein
VALVRRVRVVGVAALEQAPIADTSAALLANRSS